MTVEPLPISDFELRGVHLTLDAPDAEALDDADDGAGLGVYVTVWAPDKTRTTVNVVPPTDATDDQLAGSLIQALVAVAAMRSPGLLAAVKARLRDDQGL